MASISDEILSAIQYALDNYTTNCDRTYMSVVTKVNANKTYVIRDESGNERTVKCAIPNAGLSVGKNVWVKIPCGNIMKTHICGVV